MAAGVGAGALVLSANATSAVDLYHQTLAAKDGWASSGSGTTGGAKADTAHTFTVSTRAQLVKALGSASDTTPRIIKIKGTIDANTDASGKKLTCADYAAGTGYSLSAYLKAFDPSTYGRSKLPSGTQEKARAAAQAKQAQNIVFKVPANTTVVGVPGTKAGITGGMLQIQKVGNVIVRNLTFSDAEDCFPQWDPTDGDSGNWNSEYDAVTLRGATHVWADHNTFTDAGHFDGLNPKYYGREYQVHDGELDITKSSDLVTVEHNQFTSHDKTMLIGSSDSEPSGKLRVTLHHNIWKGIVQRAPLTRVGQVHIYNNVYDVTPLNGYALQYSINSRAKAQVVAQDNYWTVPSSIKVSKLLSGDGTGSVAGSGNLVNGTTTNLVAAYNAANSKKIKPTVNWTPTLTAGLESSAKNLPAELAKTAGAGVLTAS
ncbi:pectate lyase [Streptomyces sp. NBC_00631]